MNAPVAKRWMQIHLSTALAVMIIAGVLMALNLRERLDPLYGVFGRHEFLSDEEAIDYGRRAGRKLVRIRRYGWPIDSAKIASGLFFNNSLVYELSDPIEWNSDGAIVDISVIVVVMFGSWFVLETLYDRRSRKPCT